MKRPPPTQSTAGDHCAQSSDGSHYAGNAPKRARPMIPKAKSKAKSQHSSDGVHFTGKVTLLFADGDKVHPSLRRQLVIDNRPSLDSHELRMFVQEFDTDIVVAADCDPLELENSQNISHITNWQVWCNPKSWKISQLEMIDLIPGWRHAVLITLQRSTSCGETLNVIAIKTLKGVAENPLFFSLQDNVNK